MSEINVDANLVKNENTLFLGNILTLDLSTVETIK